MSFEKKKVAYKKLRDHELIKCHLVSCKGMHTCTRTHAHTHRKRWDGRWHKVTWQEGVRERRMKRDSHAPLLSVKGHVRSPAFCLQHPAAAGLKGMERTPSVQHSNSLPTKKNQHLLLLHLLLTQIYDLL